MGKVGLKEVIKNLREELMRNFPHIGRCRAYITEAEAVLNSDRVDGFWVKFVNGRYMSECGKTQEVAYIFDRESFLNALDKVKDKYSYRKRSRSEVHPVQEGDYIIEGRCDERYLPPRYATATVITSDGAEVDIFEFIKMYGLDTEPFIVKLSGNGTKVKVCHNGNIEERDLDVKYVYMPATERRRFDCGCDPVPRSSGYGTARPHGQWQAERDCPNRRVKSTFWSCSRYGGDSERHIEIPCDRKGNPLEG